MEDPNKSKTPRASTLARHQRILEVFAETNNVRLTSERTSYSLTQVRAVLIAHQLIGPGRPRSARKDNILREGKPLSNIHAVVGGRISYGRITFSAEARKKYDPIALELGVSPARLAAMEQGLHDFSLSELLRIAEWLKMSLSDLVMPPQLSSSLRAKAG